MPWRREWLPTLGFLPGTSHRGAWQAPVYRVAKSWTRLSNWAGICGPKQDRCLPFPHHHSLSSGSDFVLSGLTLIGCAYMLQMEAIQKGKIQWRDWLAKIRMSTAHLGSLDDPGSIMTMKLKYNHILGGFPDGFAFSGMSHFPWHLPLHLREPLLCP